jgi:hypothetical protein
MNEASSKNWLSALSPPLNDIVEPVNGVLIPMTSRLLPSSSNPAKWFVRNAPNQYSMTSFCRSLEGEPYRMRQR